MYVDKIKELMEFQIVSKVDISQQFSVNMKYSINNFFILPFVNNDNPSTMLIINIYNANDQLIKMLSEQLNLEKRKEFPLEEFNIRIDISSFFIIFITKYKPNKEICDICNVIEIEKVKTKEDKLKIFDYLCKNHQKEYDIKIKIDEESKEYLFKFDVSKIAYILNSFISFEIGKLDNTNLLEIKIDELKKIVEKIDDSNSISFGFGGENGR
jgi:hypothetical protein